MAFYFICAISQHKYKCINATTHSSAMLVLYGYADEALQDRKMYGPINLIQNKIQRTDLQLKLMRRAAQLL